MADRTTVDMLDWLSRLAIDHDGAAPSWLNPAHPGYPYPEAAGLLLTTLALARPDDRAIALTAAWLGRQVDDRGLVGRRGVGYTFDTAIALTGLLAARRVGVAVDEPTLTRMREAVIRGITSRRAVDDPTLARRWSTRWSCHQIKLAWAVTVADEILGEHPEQAAALASLTELLPLEHAGRFATAPDDPRSYVHASCYALEGVLALRRRGLDRDAGARLIRGCDWLASLQADDGSLPRWVGADDPDDVRPSDIIAQAVRLWSIVDRRRYAPSIERALAALDRRTVAPGGLRYRPSSDDVNTWSTAFAAQARRWASGNGHDEWIV